MKTVFIHAKSAVDVRLPAAALRKLPASIGVVCSIQHLHKMDDIKAQLPSAIICGQVLGCNAWNTVSVADKVDAFLFVGSGVFHPIGVAMRTRKPVYCYNPFNQEFKQITDKDIERYEARKRGQVLKYLSAKRVGILVSIKAGQKNLGRAYALQQEARAAGKEAHVFACDTLEQRFLEDFNFIDCWVNTACPRIADEALGIANIDDLADAGAFKTKTKKGWEVPIWLSKRGLAKA